MRDRILNERRRERRKAVIALKQSHKVDYLDECEYVW